MTQERRLTRAEIGILRRKHAAEAALALAQAHRVWFQQMQVLQSDCRHALTHEVCLRENVPRTVKQEVCNLCGKVLSVVPA